jgi:hypothetical protein
MIFGFLIWHFFEMPREILGGVKNFLRFGLYYFSIPFLFKTLFAHWHKYFWVYPRGFDFGKYLEVFFSNLISRILGAIIRIFLIFSGIAFEIFVLIFGIFLIFLWIILPLLLLLGFIYGIKLLFTV